MELLTINDFAALKGVGRRAIEAAINDERVDFKEKYGRRLIPLNKKNTEYSPVIGRGRKPSKRKTK